MSLTFKKAERRQVKLKIGISGPSGSGKTLSALLIAKGIVERIPDGRIALIDTENGSASLYAGMTLPNGEKVPDFETLELDPPFSTDKYIAAINAAVAGGFSVLIVDSGTHQWAGEGGILSKKEQMDARGGNSYTHWAKLTPEHEKFKSAILHSDIHLIMTLRSKQEYALVENDRGKQAPKKLGMAPIQRDGMEYEMTCMLDMDMTHNAQASKDRTSLFDGKIWVPTVDTGKALMDWLAGAKPAEPKPARTPDANQPRGTGLLCELCGADMRVSDQKKKVYCPNWQDEALGKHPVYPLEMLEKLLEQQRHPAPPQDKEAPSAQASV